MLLFIYFFGKVTLRSLVVFIHDSLEDIGYHQILQVIDFDALPDGDEFEAFLGDWLKQLSPEFAVSFLRLCPRQGFSPLSLFFEFLFLAL